MKTQRKLFYDRGGYVQVREEGGSPGFVPYPVCLAIRYGDDVPEVCPDFILNAGEAWVFVRTENPLPAGTPVHMHFFIPPEIKLLAEVDGTVSAPDRDGAGLPKGMLIRFPEISREEKDVLEGYIGGKKRLIDRKA